MQLPLHNKGTPSQILDLHMEMNARNPNGFRVAPTSRKNPKTHSKKPSTNIERMALKVHGR